MNSKIADFPITPYLEEICSAVKTSSSRFLILTAETAAGKSTVLPLALLESFSGKILMTEPRRLAVLGVANRVAQLKEEECGQSVGYKIHLENKISKNTRLEIVTEAILVKHLQEDPLISDYNLIVLDEFHERSINMDLSLAFLKEAMEVRDDLFVIIMSATIDTKKLQNYVNGAVLKIPGRQFPVEVFYEGEKSISHVICNEVNNSLPKYKGNILVFLPGISDIRKCESELQFCLSDKIGSSIELLKLHSSISLEEQKKVLENDSSLRRIILSSAIAETSLTVPGVTTVIDSGLSRINRMNLGTGMEMLSTEIESEFSADQRTGRAGRIQAGKCIRMWDKNNPRRKEQSPEILRTDLTELVLECADRGIYSSDSVDWLDEPQLSAWKTSVHLLELLGLVDSDGKITLKGKAVLQMGMHPRLACVALAGNNYSKTKTQALLLKYSTYGANSSEIQKKFLFDVENRISKLAKNPIYSELFVTNDLENERLLILEGYPDRLAKRITKNGQEPAEYQFASGRIAVKSSNPNPEWIVAPEVMAGKSKGTIFEFEEISYEILEKWLKSRTKTVINCYFDDEKVQKSEDICFGNLIISSKKLSVSSEDIAEAWINEVSKKGLQVLPLNKAVENFLIRAAFLSQNEKFGLLKKKYNSLQDKVNDWLLPFITGSSSKLSSQTVYDALNWYLDGSIIDKEAPESIILSNGKKCKVKYESDGEKIKPIIEIIIQRIFGVFKTPEICGQKVLLRLLSPASRPLQITDDLENFWSGAWVEICKEMKGRYPKHNWDYRVSEKE